MDRRRFLMGSAAVAASASAAACATAPEANIAPIPAAVEADIDELQRLTFDWFVAVTPRDTGMTPDRWPTPSFCSVAAVGFALTCWPVGVERGWMTRDEARTRTLNTIRYFHDLPQGPEATGRAGYRGFFYHFLEPTTGHRFAQCELSTIDTTLLVAGMLFAAQYFDGADPAETEIRTRAQAIYERIEWNWMVVRPNRVSMGWHPETGVIAADWHFYNEGMILLHLAMGSPTHPVAPSMWDEWCAGYDQSWTDAFGEPYLHYAALFVHQYSHMFVDYRGIRDGWMRARQAEIPGFDYFQNSVRAVQAQRRYAVANPYGFAGYSENVWGWTACDGPLDFRQVIDGREREFYSYSARGPGDRDDGTIAPTAAMASYPFAPQAVTACLREMKARYGAGIWTRYGFLDSFNPTLTQTDRTLQHGRIVPGVGWVDGDYLGIDQGPIVVMIENHRSDLIWRHMRNEPNLVRGLKAAGFAGGWLDRA